MSNTLIDAKGGEGVELRKKAWETGLVAACVVAAVLLYVLFSAPGIGAVADGSYDTVMRQLYLTCPTGMEFQTGVVIEEYAYLRLDYSSVLQPGQPSMAYPAMLVRVATEPFGLLFNTRWLACAYILIIAWGVFLAVSGLYRRNRVAAMLTAAGLALVMMHSTLVGYLNSLYDIGAVIAFAVLYLGFLIRALCNDKGCGAQWAVGVALSGTALIRSQTQMIVLMPFVLLGVVMCVVHCCPRGKARALHATACALALLFCVQSVYDGFLASPEADEDANDYLAVFQGYMLASEDPAADLAKLGIDESYAADVGRSYYEDSANFVHDPKAEEAWDMLDKISLKNRLSFCLQNGQLILRRIEQLGNHLYDAFNERLVTGDGQTRYVRPSLIPFVRLLTGEGGFARMTGWMLSAALLCMLTILISPKHSGEGKLAISLGALFLGLACYFPFTMMMTGGVDIDKFKVVFFFAGWLSLMGAIAAGITLMTGLLSWLSDKDAVLRCMPACEQQPAGLRWLEHVHISRGGLMWLTALACIGVSCWLLLPQEHVGGVNNGDFGRMMEQIDIYWMQEQLDKPEQQLAYTVIEEYSYREPFHPERLTSADPTYSLLFPSMVVRGWSALTGAPFDTRLLAFVLLTMTCAAILLIIHDLYPLWGKATIILAAGLVMMLFGENYVAWYNALFGESSISTGLMMTIACAVHLCVMPRGSKKCWLWLILLGGSVRFLSCAKAQMALALPVGLVLMLVLAIYHRPKGFLRMTAFALVMVITMGAITWDTLGIYRKNEGISERQTVWQSVFYGALMIADDPEAAMEELGIDPAMKADIGKHAYYPDDEYVYPLMSEEADAAFYDHVDTMTMVAYYLRHPVDFLKMLDRAAQESVSLHTGFMGYTGQAYDENSSALYRFNIWRNLRPLTACRAFWQYVVLYGGAIIACIAYMRRREAPAAKKLLLVLFLCVMMIGVLQYPLSVVGNGFADNNKQLYGFMLCHDLLVLSALTAGAWQLVRRAKETKPALQERVEAQ